MRTTAIILALTLTGCIHSSRVEEKLPRPPKRFGADRAAKEAAGVGRFWELFGDGKLDSLMSRALAGSLTIEQAWARLDQARASLTLARAGWWPSVSAKAEAGRSHTAMVFNNQSATSDRNTLAVSLGVAYEVDLWGKVRYAAKAAKLELEATEDDLRAAYLSVAAQLVDGYFFAAELRAQLTLLDQTEQSRRRHLDLVERRYRSGVVTALDLYQAKQNLATARAQQHQFRQQLAAAEHAVALLAGQVPTEGRALSGTLDRLPEEVRELPPGLPAQLLLRRPDLRAAQRRLHAADAKVGQAVAGHYPSLTLSGSMGYQFDPASLVWNILGGLLLPIFEGHRVSADVELKRAQLRLALAAYKAALLQALKEVEDALVAGQQVKERVRWLEEKVTAAEGALRMSTDLYSQGLVTFLQVLTAEESVYNAKRELLSARRELVAARVQLARALGGGWMEREVRAVKQNERGS